MNRNQVAVVIVAVGVAAAGFAMGWIAGDDSQEMAQLSLSYQSAAFKNQHRYDLARRDADRAKTERTEREEALARQLAEEYEASQYYETAWQTLQREVAQMHGDLDDAKALAAYWRAWAWWYDADRRCWFARESGFSRANPECRYPPRPPWDPGNES